MVRIQFSRPTVKSLQARLCQAYQQGHVSRVRRISVLLELVVHHTPVAVVSDRWGISPACIYEWLKAFLVDGVASVAYRQHRGGRPAKLTQTQQKQLCKLIDAGPEAAGFETACWNSILIQTVIQREFGVAYNRYYVCELLRNLGYSFQKARFVSDHLDEARRQAWLTEEWPKILKQAKRRRAWILFGDEVSFPQWGSLSRTWARQGHQPTVKTTGKRKGYKMFGFIEYFSGQLFITVRTVGSTAPATRPLSTRSWPKPVSICFWSRMVPSIIPAKLPANSLRSIKIASRSVNCLPTRRITIPSSISGAKRRSRPRITSISSNTNN